MQAMGNSESESDLDWEETGKYGTDSEVGNFVLNNEQTYDYGDWIIRLMLKRIRLLGRNKCLVNSRVKVKGLLRIFLTS